MSDKVLLATVQMRLLEQVIRPGLCVGCGACVVDAPPQVSEMVVGSSGPVPTFRDAFPLDEIIWDACPGKGIDYPELYRLHYGRLPDDWRIGLVEHLWIGHAADAAIRRAGASGGVTTAILLYLLETKRIDAAIVARQGIPTAEQASHVIARTPAQIIASAQSVYVPVSMLDAMNHFVPGERYAMTCVPEQSAALRMLQHRGHPRARQVEYVLGPYTGTALDPRAIRALLRMHAVPDEDAVISLQWRAGEWPGHLEVRTASGCVVQSKKVYYNFLIPFYVTQASLQSMDFANEFTDLSVGDAWSPQFEGLGQGFSVVAARSTMMAAIVQEMQDRGLLTLDSVNVLETTAMHGHMIDFKKRGSYLRNLARRALGLASPDYGLRPVPIGAVRIAVEIVVSMLFVICRTPLARWCMEKVPERILGPLFNRLRLAWKSASKPAKRRGLATLGMKTSTPRWKAAWTSGKH